MPSTSPVQSTPIATPVLISERSPAVQADIVEGPVEGLLSRPTRAIRLLQRYL